MNTLHTNNVGSSPESRRIRWRLIGWSIPVGLLMLPLIAMQFTDEVDWDLPDFIIMGALMGMVGGGIELAVKLSKNIRYRVAAVISLTAGFLLMWVNMAVGIIGDGDLPMDLPYFLVMLGGVVGIVASRFRPAGLALTLYLMVAALVLIALAVIVTDSLPMYTTGKDLLGITGFFATLFMVSALLFQQAARDECEQVAHDD